MPKVSVIIPCYNLGKYVGEAIDSVLSSSFTDLEIIVVNDGSTDSYTNEVLRKLNKPKTRIIEIDNQGVSTARNVGIKASKGEYILPLDADDAIYPQYISKAVAVLDNNQDVGIVYAKGEFFGIKQGVWNLPKFSLKQMLNSNCIPVCGMFRRKDFDKSKGYNPNMVWGLEDWDFWLSLLEQGLQVSFIDEVLFKYRQLNVSRTTSFNNKKTIKLQQIVANHLKLYLDNIFMLNYKMFVILAAKQNINQMKRQNIYRFSRVLGGRLKWLPYQLLLAVKIYLLFPFYVYRIYQNLKELSK